MVSFTPKGSDGAQTYDGTPMSRVEPRNMRLATDAFRGLTLAIQKDDESEAADVFAGLVDALDDEINPHGLLIIIGVMFNAWLIRSLAGDPDPNGRPTTPIDLNLIAIDRDTAQRVTLPLEETAVRAIHYAANWQWDQLNAYMVAQVEASESKDEFMHELASCLISMFIGVGGIDSAGWRD